MILIPTGESEALLQVKSLSKLTVRRYSLLWNWRTILTLLLSLGAMNLATSVRAARPNPSADPIDKDVRYVDCGSTNKLINSINGALASLDPSEGNTVNVRGACKENVTISGFDRLQLIAQNGASITDASGDTAAVISIDNSTRVLVQGFTVNGHGPNAQFEVIDCTFSLCTFSANTVQGGSDGIDVFRGARASLNGDVFQDNVNGAGISVGQSGFAVAIAVTLQRNGTGASVSGGGFLQLNRSTVQNNSGPGIQVHDNGMANLSASIVTGNAGNGINVLRKSSLTLGFAGGANGSSITNNVGAGVLVKDLSFANFPDGAGSVVKNNSGGTDVLCSAQFPATRGALTNIGGGVTNCVEP